jgi:hypothetical protein
METKESENMKTRAELKREYKETVKDMGVLAIRNLRNGRMWLGSSPNPDAAFTRFRFELRLGSSWHKDLQNDWNEFGEDAFAFEVLDTIKPDPLKDKIAELSQLETLWREKLAEKLVNEYK